MTFATYAPGFRGVPELVWNFHIGGYQVCEKWLKDRKGRTLSADENLHDLDTANDGTFFMLGNNGMLLQSGDTRPRFTGLRVLADRCVMEFDPRPQNKGGLLRKRLHSLVPLESSIS